MLSFTTFPKIFTVSFFKFIIISAFFIEDLLSSSGISHCTTSVLISIALPPKKQGKITHCCDFILRPSPKRNTEFESNLRMDAFSFSFNVSIKQFSQSSPQTVLEQPESRTIEPIDSPIKTLALSSNCVAVAINVICTSSPALVSVFPSALSSA